MKHTLKRYSGVLRTLFPEEASQKREFFEGPFAKILDSCGPQRLQISPKSFALFIQLQLKISNSSILTLESVGFTSHQLQ